MKDYIKSFENRDFTGVQELSVLLGISRSLAYGLCSVPGAPTIKIGKRILVPKQEMLEFLKENRQIDL